MAQIVKFNIWQSGFFINVLKLIENTAVLMLIMLSYVLGIFLIASKIPSGTSDNTLLEE